MSTCKAQRQNYLVKERGSNFALATTQPVEFRRSAARGACIHSGVPGRNLARPDSWEDGHAHRGNSCGFIGRRHCGRLVGPGPGHPVRQPQCSGHRPDGRGRHHVRPGLRFRAVQGARLPAAEGGRIHLRRWPLAEQHHGGAGGARQSLHEGDLLPDRQARPVSPGDPQGGGGRGPHDRRPHLVARQSRQGEGREGHRGDREGLQRGQARHRHQSFAVLPLPLPAGSGSRADLSRHAATSRSSRTTSTASTSRCASPRTS